MPNPELDAAYRNTDYRVLAGPQAPFAIAIDEFCIELEELMLDECEFDWAYVTACNPGSQLLSDEENDRRMTELQEYVRPQWPRIYFGMSYSRDGSWPAEPSLLVLGLMEADAVELGRRFGQNAAVVGRAGERARLVWVK